MLFASIEKFGNFLPLEVQEFGALQGKPLERHV